MNVLIVTGSRHGCSSEQQRDALRRAIESCGCVLHGNGDGVDQEADTLARELDKDLIVVPALWTPRGKPAGPMRNSLMVRIGVALRDYGHAVSFLALPSHEPKGTRDCLTKLKAARIGGTVVAPD